MAKSKELQLRDIVRSLQQALRFVEDMQADNLAFEEVKAAAAQASQANNDLQRLVGQLLHEPGEKERQELLEMFRRFNKTPAEMGLSRATVTALTDAGITYVHELVVRKENDLLVLPGLGRARVLEIKRALERWNMQFDMPPLA